MCVSASDQWTSPAFRFPIPNTKSRRRRVRILRLKKRRTRSEEKMGKDMELKNLKLYMENITIFEENEKLRRKASLLHQENLTLMSEFHKIKKLCDQVDHFSPNYSSTSSCEGR